MQGFCDSKLCFTSLSLFISPSGANRSVTHRVCASCVLEGYRQKQLIDTAGVGQVLKQMFSCLTKTPHPLKLVLLQDQSSFLSGFLELKQRSVQ